MADMLDAEWWSRVRLACGKMFGRRRDAPCHHARQKGLLHTMSVFATALS